MSRLLKVLAVTALIALNLSGAASRISAHETVYTVYVHADCPHCKNVEDFVRDNGLENDVIYKQLKFNEKNMEELEGLWEEFNVTEEERGWPFMVYEADGVQQYLVGDIPIIQQLADDHDIEVTQNNNTSGTTGSSSSGSDGSTVLIMGVGAIILLAIFGYGIYSTIAPAKK